MHDVENKLECLRLATEYCTNLDKQATFILELAKDMYKWINENDKPNLLTFEKISKERE